MMRIGIFAVAVAALASVACGGNVFDLEVGDCFDDPDNFTYVTDVEMVNCDEAHDNEVFALFDLNDGSYPGDSAIHDAASEGCFDAFQPYVGRAYASSTLDFSWIVPTSESWGQGDRAVVCIVYDLDFRKLHGSMKNSGA